MEGGDTTLGSKGYLLPRLRRTLGVLTPVVPVLSHPDPVDVYRGSYTPGTDSSLPVSSPLPRVSLELPTGDRPGVEDWDRDVCTT